MTMSNNVPLFDTIWKKGHRKAVGFGPIFTEIIGRFERTELEKVVVDELIQKGLVKFYARYVDDTLLLVKPEDIQWFSSKPSIHS